MSQNYGVLTARTTAQISVSGLAVSTWHFLLSEGGAPWVFFSQKVFPLFRKFIINIEDEGGMKVSFSLP